MREMKDSGIEWIGIIPKDWNTTRIKYLSTGEFNSFVDGDWIESPVIIDSGIRYYTTGNIGDGIFKCQGNGFISEKTFDILHCKYAYPGDLVISRLNAPYGRSCIIPNEYVKCVLAVDIAILRTEADKRYLCYVTQCSGYQSAVEDKAAGTTMKRISRTNLGNVKLPLPPVNIQHIVADYLDFKCTEIDILSADIQSEIETLEAYKQSVITEAVTKGLDKNAPMKESGVQWCPHIPFHWKYTNPKALFSQRFDRALHGDRQLTASQEYGIVYQDEFMEMTGNKVVTVMKDFSILKHVEPGDFVISMRSFQGGLEYSEVKGCISSAYVMLIPNRDLVYPPFYKWFFKSSKYINAIQSTSNLVRYGQAMRYANFVQVPLFIIPKEEQKKIADYLDERISEIDIVLRTKREQLTVLSDYKKSIIYEYVTGKKEVPAS